MNIPRRKSILYKNIGKKYLFTSNPKKIREFQRFGIRNLEILKGEDISEIMSDSLNISR